MRSRLLFSDRDLVVPATHRSRITKGTTHPTPSGPENDTAADLGLDLLWDAMGGGDEFVRAVAAAVTNEPLADPDTIRYRQEVLEDCLPDPDALRRLHQLAVDAIQAEAGVYHRRSARQANPYCDGRSKCSRSSWTRSTPCTHSPRRRPSRPPHAP